MTGPAMSLLDRISKLMEAGFTGKLEVEWKDGVPQLVRTTDVQRLAGRHSTNRIDRKRDG